MNDEKALRAIGRGDEDALAWVIDRYAAYVSAVVFNILGAAMQTEDLEETVSDVFLALWANSGKVKPGKLKAYLGGIARNKAKEKLRSACMEISLEDNLLVYNGDAVVALPGWERVPVNEELAADLAESIGAVDASVAWDGYTLKVEAALYDPQTQSGLLYYSIENPDGVSGYVVRAQNSVIFPKESIDFAPGLGSGWGGACYLDEVRTTATKVYLCTYYIGCEGIAGEDWEPDKLQLLVRSNMDGELLASVEFEHSCGSVSGLNLAGGSIVVSPIGIRIYSAEMGYESGNDIKSIVLNFDSGKKYVVLDESNVLWEGTDNTTYGLLDGVSDAPSVTYTFNRLVDIGALESVTINGCDY